ncbi:MAG: hypothetical protein N839_0007940 [Desulfofustis sp. PB-SRB1]|jgi:hypothetical protein|nr:hypothetical protein [Desulfofustis sp. PB-SRB1]MBM1002332.1 hypothetical protein [Desulfofustis sp. PB-SRB1]HBH29035.1 hypothetical protein [Desulfofustis sp.]HBH31397.1 hypothetical protein [Desulfofustis sp.]
MTIDKLAKLREEWYSQPDHSEQTEEEHIDDELLELNILFKSRGVTVAGENSVTVSKDETDKKCDNES